MVIYNASNYQMHQNTRPWYIENETGCPKVLKVSVQMSVDT